MSSMAYSFSISSAKVSAMSAGVPSLVFGMIFRPKAVSLPVVLLRTLTCTLP